MTPVEMVGQFERHVLPSGVEVFYRDSDHAYYGAINAKGSKVSGVKDARLAGVSTVVAPFDWAPDGLMKWAANLNCEGVAALAAEGLGVEDVDDMRATLGWLVSGEAITSALFDARLHYTQRRDDRATEGTNVHKHALQALATGRATPDYASMTDEEQGYAHGVVQFWLDTEPRPRYAEQVVCDPTLRVAGRLDLICEMDGARVVVDAKTSGYIPTKHHVQIAGYRHCAQVSGLGETTGGFILQVTPDGGYDLIPAEAEAEDFMAAVDVYRRAARIKSGAGVARKERAAA